MLAERIFVCATAFIFFCCPAVCFSDENSTKKTLQNVCNVYSQQWAGVKLHYKGGSREFHRHCEAAIEDKDLLSGLWAIRSIIPDGHAGFAVKTKVRPQIYPLILEYNVQSNNIMVAGVLRKSLAKYVGKKVSLINGVNALEFIKVRAKLEPQSTFENSLVVAARTILYQLSWKPYPDFPKSVTIVFDGGDKIHLRPKSLRKLIKRYPYLLNRNAYPSIWLGLATNDENACITKAEVAKIISYNGSDWLWWHPASMHFDLANVDSAFRCWSEMIKKVDGVILDLRDTAGGGGEESATVANVLGIRNKLTFRRRNSKGKIAEYPILASQNIPQRWGGKVVVVTNGLCGSACEFLGEIVSKRKNTCSYGTPTAGRKIGYTDIKINEEVSLEVPMRAYLDSRGRVMEGKPFIPRHVGTGNVYEALKACTDELD